MRRLTEESRAFLALLIIVSQEAICRFVGAKIACSTDDRVTAIVEVIYLRYGPITNEILVDKGASDANDLICRVVEDGKVFGMCECLERDRWSVNVTGNEEVGTKSVFDVIY